MLQVLQERLQECQCQRHHNLEVEGPSDTENIRCSFETGIFWFFKARSDSGALLSAMTQMPEPELPTLMRHISLFEKWGRWFPLVKPSCSPSSSCHIHCLVTFFHRNASNSCSRIYVPVTHAIHCKENIRCIVSTTTISTSFVWSFPGQVFPIYSIFYRAILSPS